MGRKGKYSEFHWLYNSSTWHRVREQKLSETPYCEVSAYMDRYIYDNLHVDHIIPLAMGGSPYDLRNLMSITRELHTKKTTMELRKGDPLVDWVDTLHGRIPVDRQQVIEKICGKSGPKHEANVIF